MAKHHKVYKLQSFFSKCHLNIYFIKTWNIASKSGCYLSTNLSNNTKTLEVKSKKNVWRRQLFLTLTHESSYCFQRVLAIAILSVCLSLHLSVTRVDQLKTVQARITKSLPSAAWKTLVSGNVKLFHKFEGVTPYKGAKWEGGWKNLRVLANKLLYLNNGAR